jgi:hypothetical protein
MFEPQLGLAALGAGDFFELLLVDGLHAFIRRQNASST